ncbi:MAG: hypothetical protein Q9159_000308 [Coniocarpon cinnabarinum]
MARMLVCLLYGQRLLSHNRTGQIVEIGRAIRHVSQRYLPATERILKDRLHEARTYHAHLDETSSQYWSDVYDRLLRSLSVGQRDAQRIKARLAVAAISNSRVLTPDAPALFEWLRELKGGVGTSSECLPWATAATGMIAHTGPHSAEQKATLCKRELEGLGISVRDPGGSVSGSGNINDVDFFTCLDFDAERQHRDLLFPMIRRHLARLRRNLQEGGFEMGLEIDFLFIARDLRVLEIARQAEWETLFCLGHGHMLAGRYKHIRGTVINIKSEELRAGSRGRQDMIYDLTDVHLWRPPHLAVTPNSKDIDDDISF